MKNKLLLLLLLLNFNVLAFAATPGEVRVGELLRESRLDGLMIKASQFSNYRGKPLLINIWASWCGPCREEMGSLERLSQRFSGREFNVIGISTDDDRYAAEAFLRYAKVSFPNYIDHNVILENMLGANKIPLTILVDGEGRILSKISGSRNWESREAIELITRTFRQAAARR